MSEIKINVDLDLETKKAKDQLDNFKKSVKDTKIPVELDISKVKQDAHGLKNILSDAFKIDSKTIGDLEQIGNALKQINKLIKNQNDLSKKGGNSRDTFVPFTVSKNANIVKDVSNLVDDYKSATKQLDDLDKVGKQMKEALDGFNKDQEEAYKKFVKDSKNYESYLKELEGDNLNSTLKKAIKARKKSIDLQEQLTKAGVVKVDNTQLRNEQHDGTIFTIENEKWKAMFAKTEAEAKDLEDLARKLKPKIDDANNTVSELITTMSTSERKLLDSISKAYENKPKFDSLSGYDNDNISVLKMYLESLMPDVDKMGLDFDNFDDIFRGIDRFYSRLEQMQNEYNSKYANEEGFKAFRMESLLDIEQEEAKRIINEAENNNNLLENVLKDRLSILNKSDSEETLNLGVDEKSLKSMEEFIRLSSLINRDTKSSSGGRSNSVAKEVNEYLAVTRKINELQSQLYKSDVNGTSSISKSLKEEIDLLRQKQLTSASAIRANRDLYESTKDMIKVEEQLSNARRNTKETIIDNDTLTKLDKTYKELDKIQNKLTSMQNTKGFLDNSLVEKTNSLLSETRSKLDANGIESDFKEIGNAVDKLNNNLKELNTGNTLSKQESSFNVSLQNMENRVNSFVDKCKEMGNAEHLIEKVENAFRSIDTSNIERANVDLKQMTSTLRDAEREAKQLSSTLDKSRGFFSNFGEEFRDNLFTFTAGELLADGIRNVVSSLGTLVMEYDTAMTNLKKVANPEDIMNISQLDAIEQKAVQIAKNVGQSSQDVIQAISDTIQMGGYGMEQATQIAEQTMMLANVAELTQEVASQGVVTMMSAFNLDPMKQMEVSVRGVKQSTDELTNSMDALNYVGNNFAISSGGILDAITSGSNVLANYGVSLNDTVAMITAANTTLQDASRVGNGLKTIQTKLAGIKASADTGELSLNKTAMALKEIAKINVFSNEKKGELKGMAEIIEELGAKWSGFTDKQRAGLSEAIAGANQASVFQSLMSNIDVMKQVQAELNDGWHFGSAIAENAAYVDSISGKLNTLKETWVGVFNTIFNSQAAKDIIDIFIKISEAIAKVVTTLDDLGLLTPVLVSLGAALASKSFKGISNIFGGGEKSAKGFANALSGLSLGLKSMNPPVTQLGANVVGMGSKFATATSSVGGFLASASTMMPYVAGTALAVTSVAKAVDYFVESLDEEEKRLNSTVAARKEEISTLEQQKSKLSEIQKEYDELSKKPDKTSKEVEKLTELTKELAEIKPELVVGYDKNNNPILSLTGDVQGLITEIDRAIDSKDRLLSHEKEESAKNAIKQLHGDATADANRNTNTANYNTEMAQLERQYSNHVSNMHKLESERDKILNKLYKATGDERRKLLKELDEANYNIEAAQDKFIYDYQAKLSEIKQYSDKIGESLFTSIENSALFKGSTEELQKQFLDLKQHLDFSDIKTEDQLYKAEMALHKLYKAAQDGKVDFDNIKSSIEKANTEFAKTGDSEKYAQSIEEIVNKLKLVEGLEHIDFSVLSGMFDGMDTSMLKATDSMDEFLRAYSKTANDLLKSDKFALALAEQKRQIETAFNDLEITGIADLDLQMGYALASNTDLPEQVRKMVTTLLGKNFNSTEVLQFTQEVLVDLSTGELNVDELQKRIDETFGEGIFEVTPEILLSDKTRLAGIEQVISQIQERFGEIPPTIKTIIEAEGITAFNEAKQITEMYLAIPENIRTVMTNNGMESAEQIIMVNQLLQGLPPEVVTDIVTNHHESIKGATDLKDVLSKLPTNLLLNLKHNYPEVVEKSQLLQEAINDIPLTKNSKVTIEEELKKSPLDLLSNLFGLKSKSELNTKALVTAEVVNLSELQSFEKVWNSIRGTSGNGASGATSSGKSGKSIDLHEVSPINDVSDLSRAAKSSSGSVGGSSTNGFNATVNVVVNGMEALKELQNTMNNFTLKDIQATVSVNTAQAAKNMSGLIQRINQTKAALNTLSSKNVVVNTAQSAKNLSGLIVRVNQYKSAIDSSISRTVDIHTAQAAKNVSGTIRKIDEYNRKTINTKTVKVNTSSAISQINTLLNKINALPKTKTVTVKVSQSGSVPKTSSKRSISEPLSLYNDTVQARTLGVQAQLRDSYSAEPINTDVSVASDIPMVSPMARKLAPGNVMSYFSNNVNAFANLENALEKIAEQLDFIDKKASLAFGKDKAKLLKEQVLLLKQQQNLQHQMSNDLKVYRNELRYFLSQNGVYFGTDGSVVNYQEKLLSIAKQIDSLQSKSNNSKDDSAKNKYNSQIESLEKVKKALEEYVDINNSKIPDCSTEWWNLQQQINDVSNAILEAEAEARDFKIELDVKQLESSLNKIQRELSKLDREIDKAFGSKKEQLLNQKIDEIKNQQGKLHQLANKYREQAASIGKYLNSLGFNIQSDGIIDIGYLEKLKGHPAFDFISDQLEKYLELTQDTVPDLSEEWWDLQDSIESAKDEIEEARKELEKFLEEAKIDALVDEFNDLVHKIDLIDKKLKHATGKDKLDLMSEKLELIKKQQIEVQKHLEFYNSKKSSLQGYLGGLGFKFDSDGDITNYVQQLEKIANSSSDFEEVKEKLEEYFKIQNDELPGLESEWQDLENAYKDALKEQLETTREIEEKITDIYKKQIEDRIDAMNKETDEKVKALKKQQDAYNKYRNEVDYKNEYEDKLSEVNDIQRQLDIAMRDSSLQGQKKVKELQKLLADAQKELDKITQDKIDSDVNNAFKDEIDRITESNENAIEQLKKEWSDSKIAEMVSQAISTGIFTGIDGQISGLQDAMLEFAQSTGELFGVMGSVIKSELITNLDIAIDTLKNLDNILKELDLTKYSTLSNNVKLDLTGLVDVSATPVQTSNIEFNAPLINIEGNVDDGVMKDLKSLQDEMTNNIIKQISNSIR